MKNYTLSRDNERPLQFYGEIITELKHHSSVNKNQISVVCTLYKTQKENYIVRTKSRTIINSQVSESYQARIFSTPGDMIKYMEMHTNQLQTALQPELIA